MSSESFLPMNSLVGPTLTDMYQISMTYAHWKNGRVNEPSCFDLFFRKNPFKGEFTLFCGLEEVLRFCHSFKFTEEDIVYLQSIMPTCDPAFFPWLQALDCREVKLFAHREGSIVFPREPLIRVEGPLGICQLLETTLLTLVNYPSLLATNALRIRLATGPSAELLEFGLRRAQGPDGGVSASKYAIMGGFDGTSNVIAGRLYGMPVKGTHAHAYVMSYTSLSALASTTLCRKDDPAKKQIEFVSVVLEKRSMLYGSDGAYQTNDSELAAFISYAQAFPDGVLCLVDTFDTLKSGVPNFLSVGLALIEFGYKPIGIRLDSGDLAYLSREARKLFRLADSKAGLTEVLGKCKIVASNDLDEDTILSLIQQGHEINTFGIGTNLVTCKKQPALGCVYKVCILCACACAANALLRSNHVFFPSLSTKIDQHRTPWPPTQLVEIRGEPRIKLSEDAEKVVIPGRKTIYRLWGVGALRPPLCPSCAFGPSVALCPGWLGEKCLANKSVLISTPLSHHSPLSISTTTHHSEDHPLMDVLQREDEAPPQAGKRILCRHPFEESKRANVTPTRVEKLLELVFDGARGPEHSVVAPLPKLLEIKDYVTAQIVKMRRDHIRHVNPTPYKVSLSGSLYDFMHQLWLENAPITDIH